MGEVFAALDTFDGKTVAVKLLPPAYADDPLRRKRFLREAQTAAMIQGPHIIPVTGLFEEGEALYLVMEYIRGGSLQPRIRHTLNRDIGSIISIARQVAQGLAIAHAAGIIHRDIKPSNILLDERGETAWITDFGLAALDSGEPLTTTGHQMGTPAYMSPEQVRGEALDHRTDLFSLGCVMYAMVTGHSPFHAENVVATSWRITNHVPPNLCTLDSRIPPAFAAIVERLLRKSPGERFSSAQDVDRALAECLSSDAIPEHILGTDSLADQPTVALRPRKQRRAIVLAALVVLAMGSLIWSLVTPLGFDRKPVNGGGRQADGELPEPGSNAADVNSAETAHEGPEKEAALAAHEPKEWIVAKEGAADFQNLTDALAAAGPHDRIEVRDAATYDGPLVISDPYRLEGVQLIARQGAVIRCSNASGRLATLSIQGTRHVQIEGFTIEGGYELHTVSMSGDVAGTKLVDLSLVQPPNSLWANLLLARECRGTAAEPLIVRSCRINSPKFGVFVGRDDIPEAVEVAHLLIDGNSFAGPGTHIEITHSARHVRIEHNRFQEGYGVRLRLAGVPSSSKISLVNNTFFENESWLSFGSDREDYDGMLANNLIVACRSKVWSAEFERRSARWELFNNICEDAEANVAEQMSPFGKILRDAGLKSKDPAAADFLKPNAGGPSATGGAGLPLPEYVGAIAPDQS